MRKPAGETLRGSASHADQPLGRLVTAPGEIYRLPPASAATSVVTLVVCAIKR
ncbi:hypothetical protein LNQ03_08290 [Klebsiella pneumoniae subsp. pneumoniae]|nr:hypothetical protein [Klebsiella pneumoniae subsp. pneumoniae]